MSIVSDTDAAPQVGALIGETDTTLHLIRVYGDGTWTADVKDKRTNLYAGEVQLVDEPGWSIRTFRSERSALTLDDLIRFQATYGGNLALDGEGWWLMGAVFVPGRFTTLGPVSVIA